MGEGVVFSRFIGTAMADRVTTGNSVLLTTNVAFARILQKLPFGRQGKVNGTMTIEQLARDILEVAIRDGLVSPAVKEWDDPDPQCRSSGELVAVANLISKFLRDRKERRDGS